MEILHTKDKILAGMLNLIWEVGLERSSIALLSQRIKISPGNIYYYFKGKEDIVNSLCYYCFDQLASAVRPKEFEVFYNNSSHDCIEEEFRSFIMKIIIFYKNNPYIINYMTILNGSSYVKKDMKKRISIERDTYWKFLEVLKERKIIKNISTDIMILFITSTLYEVIVQDVVLNNIVLDDKKVESVFHLIWSGISLN